jgi:predicted amidohydrolase
MVTANQAYGGGTMIADLSQWPACILQRCPDREEAYITASVNLRQVRRVRATSRNFARRRPDLYGDLVRPVAPSPEEGAAQIDRRP